jgi:hypothetical protein
MALSATNPDPWPNQAHCQAESATGAVAVIAQENSAMISNHYCR